MDSDLIAFNSTDGAVFSITVEETSDELYLRWRLVRGDGTTPNSCGTWTNYNHRDCGPLPADGNPYRLQLEDSDHEDTGTYGVGLIAIAGNCGDQPPATPAYTYWLEIAAHLPGQFGSQWRTDVVTKNDGAANAMATFVLHTVNGSQELSNVIAPSEQAIFADIVGIMGEATKGTLEIRSTEPLKVIGRTYNESSVGTFGQFFGGYTNEGGLSQGQSAAVLGLRQMEGEFRTNITVSNTGSEAAVVKITLYASDGTQLTEYTLLVEPRMVVQESEPFKARAGLPNLGWGYAFVEVTAGSGVLTSASVVDSRTNDATTIPMLRRLQGE